jgi:hypothetical protein
MTDDQPESPNPAPLGGQRPRDLRGPQELGASPAAPPPFDPGPPPERSLTGLTTDKREIWHGQPDLVPAYQHAFAGDPWYERTKCVSPDPPLSPDPPDGYCKGEYSPLEIGDTCPGCHGVLTTEAYPPDELLAKWRERLASSPVAVYVERVDREGAEGAVALAAIGWAATAFDVAAEYPKQPVTRDWLKREILPPASFYLAEIFCDARVRSSGNLENLDRVIRGFAQVFVQDTVVFRSKNVKLIGKTKRLFGDRCTVFAGLRERADVNLETAGEVPGDSRDFLIIRQLLSDA